MNMKKRTKWLAALFLSAAVAATAGTMPAAAGTITGEVSGNTVNENTGDDENTEDTGDTGDPGDTEDAGNIEDPGDTGDMENIEDPEDAENTETGADAAEEVVVTEEDKPYLSLGSDLSAQQRATVLSLLGVTEEQLAEFDISYVTNQEEHQYLDNYISADKIGTRSLSSVVVMQGEKGKGIRVTTKNISYCTIGMYQNALATAGVKDAEVIVAGPTNISGTAGLVGVLKAYETMTGDPISKESMDTALNELVITGEIADTVGDSDTIEGMIAYIKQDVVANKLDDRESIGTAIDEASKEFNVSLTSEEREKVIDLMTKIGDLDLDPDTLEEQAKNIYDKVNDLLGEDTMQKIKDKLNSDGAKNFFQRIIEKIKAWFASL